MAWFRFYDEVLDDPKVQRLSLKNFRGWVNILCIAKRNNGVLPDLSSVAFALRMTDAEANELLNNLIQVSLIDKENGIIRPHNWNGRQFSSDVSTERVKRFRKRHETFRETPPDTDTDTDTDTEEHPKTDACPKPRNAGSGPPTGFGMAFEQTSDGKSALPAIEPSVSDGQDRGLAPARRKASATLAARFEDFWAVYPRREKKKQAREIWRRKRLDRAADEIIADVRRRRTQHKPWVDGYIPHPTSYLNGERWKDEITAEIGGANGANRRNSRESECERVERQMRERAAERSTLSGHAYAS